MEMLHRVDARILVGYAMLALKKRLNAIAT
jgi:hypothetical protein